MNRNQNRRGVTNAEGKRIGEWAQFYPDGVLKSQGLSVKASEGRWKFCAETGQLIQEGTYRDGEFQGNWRWYYIDGSLHRDESYRKGKADGRFLELDRQGKTLVEGRYDYGLKQGPWLMDVNDHREEGRYVDGERHGTWIHTFPNGTEQFKGEFEMGLPVGRHVYGTMAPPNVSTLQPRTAGGQVALRGRIRCFNRP